MPTKRSPRHKVPDRGDIIFLQFDPSAGSEMRGGHYALVVSREIFNALGLAVVCPISQGAAEKWRQGLGASMLVSLYDSGTDTLGLVHCHQVKSIDWSIRGAAFKERAPQHVVDEVMMKLEAIVLG